MKRHMLLSRLSQDKTFFSLKQLTPHYPCNLAPRRLLVSKHYNLCVRFLAIFYERDVHLRREKWGTNRFDCQKIQRFTKFFQLSFGLDYKENLDHKTMLQVFLFTKWAKSKKRNVSKIRRTRVSVFGLRNFLA